MQDPAFLMVAYRMVGIILQLLEEFATARAYLEQAITLYDPQQHRSQAFLQPQDHGVAALSYTAHALWYLGYPDQALKRSQEALALAHELSHPSSLAFALHWATGVHRFRREVQAAQERAEALMALASEQGFRLWLVMGTLTQGWVLTEQGQYEKGIAQMRQGIAAFKATGAELGLSGNFSALAEAYGKVGQVEEGLAMLAEVLTIVNKTGERFYEAEVYRLKGTLTLQQLKVQGSKSKVPSTQHPTPSTQTEAEACFLKAIEIARRQSAKSFELRAVMSLAQLWQQQGKRKQARKMLAEIYGWFTEGFDTADLKEARALLQELT